MTSQKGPSKKAGGEVRENIHFRLKSMMRSFVLNFFTYPTDCEISKSSIYVF